MTERNFSTIVARLNPSVPGAPYATILNYVRDAAVKACERTLAWRYAVPLFNLTPGVHDYAFDRPDNADVHAVFAVLVNDCPLKLLTLDDAIMQYPAWANLFSGEDASVVWSETPSGAIGESYFDESLFNEGSAYVLPDAIVAEGSSPGACCMVSPDKYIILPLPDGETYSTRMFLGLKPKRDATSMDTVIFDELEDVILHKALEDMLVLPNVPWADRELAVFHSRKYASLSSERRARANLGHVRGSMSVRMTPFA